jgi:hypothetical protein
VSRAPGTKEKERALDLDDHIMVNTLCIVLSFCVDKLFDPSVFGFQPTVQSRCADITIILGLDC